MWCLRILAINAGSTFYIMGKIDLNIVSAVIFNLICDSNTFVGFRQNVDVTCFPLKVGNICIFLLGKTITSMQHSL